MRTQLLGSQVTRECHPAVRAGRRREAKCRHLSSLDDSSSPVRLCKSVYPLLSNHLQLTGGGAWVALSTAGQYAGIPDARAQLVWPLQSGEARAIRITETLRVRPRGLATLPGSRAGASGASQQTRTWRAANEESVRSFRW